MLIVRKSKIKGAGYGLFTTSRIRKGDMIVEYLGKVMTWKAVCRKYNGKEEDLRYVFYVNKDICIDAHSDPDAFAAFANDANGTKVLTGKAGRQKNNAEYEVKKKRPYIVATKNIGPNSEIYVDYGDEYWDAIKEAFDAVKKEKAEAKAKKKKKKK